MKDEWVVFYGIWCIGILFLIMIGDKYLVLNIRRVYVEW